MPYRPFERLDFNDRTCYLSGSKENVQHIPVFPDWLLDGYALRDKPFKLLDESMITYNDIRVPCSEKALEAVQALEQRVQEAMMGGYDSAKALDRLVFFQWIARLVYGIIYYEVRAGIRQQALIGEQMVFSQSLLHKFSNFHLMLQSLVTPVVIEGPEPWSIEIVKLNNPPETFSYRDEINTLTFSLRMQDFGIIACLQDNGANAQYNKAFLDVTKGQTLHPIQFQELCARFFYSSYLFNRLPEYTVLHAPDATYIEAMPLRGISSKPLFDAWQAKTYGQVVENFWKPWGFSLFEIIRDPEHPKSFLTDLNGDWNSLAAAELPLE